MSGLDPIIKLVLGNTVSIVLRVVGFTLFGVAINISLLVMQWERISSVFSGATTPQDIAVGTSIILTVVLFPVVYFILGQKQAFQKAISNLLKTRKFELVYWLVSKLHERRPELFGTDGQIQLTSLKVIEYITEVVRDLPGFIVKLLKFLIDKTEFSSKFVKAVNDLKTKEGDNAGASVEKVSEIVSNMIPGDIIEPDIKIPLMVVVFNAFFFFV